MNTHIHTHTIMINTHTTHTLGNPTALFNSEVDG